MFAAEAPRSGELTDSFDTHHHAMTALEKATTFSGEGEPDYNTLLSDSFMAELWKDSNDLPLERGGTFDGASPHAKHAPPAGAGAACGHAAAVAHAQPAARAEAAYRAGASGHATHDSLQTAGGAADAPLAPGVAASAAPAPSYPVADAHPGIGGAGFASQRSGHVPPELAHAAPQHAQPSGGGVPAQYGGCDGQATIFTEMPTPGPAHMPTPASAHMQHAAPPLACGALSAAPLAAGAGADGGASAAHMARVSSGGGAVPPAAMGAAPQRQPSPPQRVDSGGLRRSESGAAAAAAQGDMAVARDKSARSSAADVAADAAGAAAGESPEATAGDDAKPDADDAERPDKKSPTVTTVQVRPRFRFVTDALGGPRRS